MIQKTKTALNYTYLLSKMHFKPKIFCISMQRSGTTSVGQFFRHFGYRVAGYGPHSTTWSKLWHEGNFEKIFSSLFFRTNQVFEDNPWFLPDFYKYLYHRFPNAKFILLTRPADDWFNSMLKHSGGMNPGNTKRHAKIYRRYEEYKNIEANKDKEMDNLLSLEGMDEHYKQIYNQHNEEVMEFFEQHDPNRLFTSQLYSPNLWKDMGEFFGINVPEGFQVHANKSKKQI